MVTLPFAIGPVDDWDPQGYEEEEEDILTPGMRVLDEDEEDAEDEDEEENLEAIEGDKADENDTAEEDSSIKDLEKDALEELEELEDLVLQSERETLKLTDFTEEE